MKSINYIKFLFILMATVISVNASTLSYVNASEKIDYVTFTQIPKEDQRQLIHTTQLLIANLEEEQISPLRRKNKYKTVQNVLNFLLKDSYAEGEIIRPYTNSEQCIYAGWVSVMVGNKCRHPLAAKRGTDNTNTNASYERLPDALKTHIDGQITEYKTQSSKVANQEGCKPSDGEAMMICNPKLFGTKKNGDPFCSVGNQRPYNSSFGCVRNIQLYADAEAAKDASKSADDIKNEILDKIIDDGLKADQTKPDSLTNLLQLNYDVCVCKGAKGYIDNEYAKRMYNQRTCYAWLHQTQAILGRLNQGSCSQLKDLPYLKSKANEKENYMTMADWAYKAHNVLNNDIIKMSPTADDYFNYDNTDDAKWIADRPQTHETEANCKDEVNEEIQLAVKGSDEPGYYRLEATIIAKGFKYKTITPPTDGWSLTKPTAVDWGDKIAQRITNITDRAVWNVPCVASSDPANTVTVKLAGLADKQATIPMCNTESLLCEIKIKEDKRTETFINAEGKAVDKDGNPIADGVDVTAGIAQTVMLSVELPEPTDGSEAIDLTTLPEKDIFWYLSYAGGATGDHLEKVDGTADAIFTDPKTNKDDSEGRTAYVQVTPGDKKYVCSLKIDPKEPTLIDPEANKCFISKQSDQRIPSKPDGSKPVIPEGKEFNSYDMLVAVEEGKPFIRDLENYTIAWTNATIKTDQADQASFIETYESTEEQRLVTAVVTEKASGKKYICTHQVPEVEKETQEENTEGDYSIKLSKKDGEDNKGIAVAKVTKDGEEITDLSAEGLTIDWKAVRNGKDRGDSDDGTPNKDSDELISEKAGTTSLEYEVTKEKNTIDVTAVLKHADHNDKSAGVTIGPIKDDKKDEEDNTEGRNLANDKPRTINPNINNNFLRPQRYKRRGNY